MKCPRCGYVSFSETDKCKKCGAVLQRDDADHHGPASVESVQLQRDAPAVAAAADLPISRTPAKEEPVAPPAEVAPKPAKGDEDAAEWRREVRRRVQERHGRGAAKPQPPPATLLTPAADEQSSKKTPSTRTAGPYDTTIEMSGPSPKRRPAAAAEDHTEPRRSDQMPLFSEAATGETSDAREPPVARRAAAAIIDALLVAIPWAVALVSADRVLDAGLWSLLATCWLPFFFLFLALHAMYDVFFLTALGETAGQALLKMRLSGEGRLRSSRAILFALVSVISLLAVGIGFLWALFDPDHRSWPELAAGGRLAYKD